MGRRGGRKWVERKVISELEILGDRPLGSVASGEGVGGEERVGDREDVEREGRRGRRECGKKVDGRKGKDVMDGEDEEG